MRTRLPPAAGASDAGIALRATANSSGSGLQRPIRVEARTTFRERKAPRTRSAVKIGIFRSRSVPFSARHSRPWVMAFPFPRGMAAVICSTRSLRSKALSFLALLATRSAPGTGNGEGLKAFRVVPEAGLETLSEQALLSAACLDLDELLVGRGSHPAVAVVDPGRPGLTAHRHHASPLLGGIGPGAVAFTHPGDRPMALEGKSGSETNGQSRWKVNH